MAKYKIGEVVVTNVPHEPLPGQLHIMPDMLGTHIYKIKSIYLMNDNRVVYRLLNGRYYEEEWIGSVVLPD